MSTQAIRAQELNGAESELSPPQEWRAQQRTFSQTLSRPASKVALFLVGDVAAVGAAHWIAAHLVRYYLNVPGPNLNPPHYYVLYAPFFVFMLYMFGGYRSPDLRRPEKDVALTFKAISFSFLALVSANFLLFRSSGFSRYLMCTWYVICLFSFLSARLGIRAVYAALWRQGLAQRTALLVGSAQKLSQFQDALSIQRYRAYRIVGMVLPPGENPPSGSLTTLPVLGSLRDWEGAAVQNGVQLVVISPHERTEDWHSLIREILHRCQQRNIDVEMPSDLFASSALHFELDEFSGFFRFFPTPRWSLQVQRLLKGATDCAAGIVGSLVTVSLTPLIALLIWMEDRGPVFYRREFVGCDGEIHYYLKFRTMRVDADDELRRNAALKARFNRNHKLEQDPRVTRIGRILRKYSVDECPQFFSLLLGQLTLVGPRVISSEEKCRYGQFLPRLLSFKPGITGYWQVMGRQTTSYAERVQMDMFYIEKWTIWLDLLIIARTFWKVIRAEGAY